MLLHSGSVIGVRLSTVFTYANDLPPVGDLSVVMPHETFLIRHWDNFKTIPPPQKKSQCISSKNSTKALVAMLPASAALKQGNGRLLCLCELLGSAVMQDGKLSMEKYSNGKFPTAQKFPPPTLPVAGYA